MADYYNYSYDANGNLVKKKKEKESPLSGWIQKGSEESVAKTILGTGADVVGDLLAGAIGMGEGIVDFGATVVGGVGKLVGADQFASNMEQFVKKDLYDANDVAKTILSGFNNAGMAGSSMVGGTYTAALKNDKLRQEALRTQNYVYGSMEQDSVLAEKADSVVQSIGQMLTTSGVAGMTGVPWEAITAVTSFGDEMDNALKSGADFGAAIGSSAISAAGEVLGEKLFSGSFLGEKGIFGNKAKDVSKSLGKGLAVNLWNTAKGYLNDMKGEAIEEVFSQAISNLGSALYKEKSLGAILADKEALQGYVDAAIGGALMGGVANVKKATVSAATGKDYDTGLTQNEQKVFQAEYDSRVAEAEKGGEVGKKEQKEIYDAVLEDIRKGNIDTDTIEKVLGGEAYSKYEATVKEEESLPERQKTLQDELEALRMKDMTAEESEQAKANEAELLEIEKKLASPASKEMRKALSDSVFQMVEKDSNLRASYYERGKRSLKFEADLDQYNAKQREVVKKAVESGILNNTRKTHELVDFVAKASDRIGTSFNWTNNQKLAESGYALEGKAVNGFVNQDGITLNINSGKALHTVVGHEITHVLEGTELYGKLSDAVVKYAKAKGVYNKRLADIQTLYEGVENAKVDRELVADLVGDYLFTDSKFLDSLVQDQNLFQRLWNEVRYLYNIATAGSDEAKELLKVKKAFEKAYQNANKNTAQMDGVAYDIVALENGNVYVKANRKVINGTTKAEQRKEITEFFSRLLDGKPSIDIQTIEGDVLTITKAETADKARDDYKSVNGQKVQMSDDEFTVKMHVEAHMDEVAEISKQIGNTADQKNHKFAKDGFTYRKAYFEDFDGQYYEITLSIGNNGTIATVYNVGKIKESVPPSAKIIAVVGSQPRGETRSDNSKPQPTPGVNPQTADGETFSLSKTDAETERYIAKSTQKYGNVEDAAINHFGITDNFRTGGYILRDGQMLDFSGAHWLDGESDEYIANWKKKNDIRQVDHEDVFEAFEISANDFPSDSRKEFINRGNIRMSPEAPGINIAAEPTAAQYQVIRDLIKNNPYNTEGFFVDIEDKKKRIDKIVYSGKVNADKVVNDIKHYYATGEVRAQSGVSRFLSLSADTDLAPVRGLTYGRDIALEEIAPQMDEIATVQEDIASANNKPQKIVTANDRTTEQLNAAYTELTAVNNLRETSLADFNEEIANLQAEYDAKKNKNTNVANELLRRIERTKARRDSVDAAYQKSISDVEARISKLSSSTYKTAMQRKAKQEQYTAMAEKLAGDTSTWVDKKLGIQYQVNTLKRNLRDVVRTADGKRDIAKADAIYDELQGKYNHNEALLNRRANNIKGEFAKLKITDAENVYIQMLGELRHNPETTLSKEMVDEFYNKNKATIDEAKVDKAIDMARKMYDQLFADVNAVLKEQGMKEIPYRKGYFPHFVDEKQNLLAKLLNWKKQNNNIPTDIAGLTENFTPNRSWQSFNKQRTSDVTDYNFLKGMDGYVRGSLDWIYHIEDIQKRRAFENYIRYVHSDAGVKEKINKILNSDEYDANEAQELIDGVYAEANNPLGNFVTDLRASTNKLAGKKMSMDRGMEAAMNRDIYSTMSQISNRVSANMVGGSISSALTNFIPITQSWGEVSPVSSLRAMRDTIRAYYVDDGVVDKSDFLTNRLNPNENLYKTKWDKVSDAVGSLMGIVDGFTSQTVWRSKYMENISKGMSENAAIKNADEYAAGLMADRSRGNMPTLFEAKNPVAKMVTAFQLEVANQYAYMLKDMPQNMKDQTTAKLVKGYLSMFIGAYAYNALYSSLVGRDAAFDPIRILEDLLRDIFDEEEEPADVAMNFVDDVLEEVPFVGGLLGGGRIPIASALPFDGNLMDTIEGIGKLAEFDFSDVTTEWMNPVYYLLLPTGGGQLRKMNQGLKMFFDDDLPIAGSYTKSGKLRFTVDETPANVLQAALFGQYASKNARQYFDENRTPLSEKQIEELKEVDLPIADYWKYRDGLKGLDTLAEKADYIASLDLPIAKKNILVNNQTDRKTPIDLTGYEKYGNFEEFDMATRYPEKYAVLKESGISVPDYKENLEKSAMIYTDDYSWAADNPGKYTLSKAITNDVTEYKQYTSDLNELKADKDKNGKAINGSAKKKKLAYINSLDIEYGKKMILYKSLYPSDNTYDRQILEYLGSREDLSVEELLTILEELGFKVNN